MAKITLNDLNTQKGVQVIIDAPEISNDMLASLKRDLTNLCKKYKCTARGQAIIVDTFEL